VQGYFLREQVVLVSKEDRSKKVFRYITNSAPRQVDVLGATYLNGAISGLNAVTRGGSEIRKSAMIDRNIIHPVRVAQVRHLAGSNLGCRERNHIIYHEDSHGNEVQGDLGRRYISDVSHFDITDIDYQTTSTVTT